MHNLLKFMIVILVVHTCFSSDVKRLQKSLKTAPNDHSDSKVTSFVSKKEKTMQIGDEIFEMIGDAAIDFGTKAANGPCDVAPIDCPPPNICPNCCGAICAGACFSPETVVSMADGSVRRIDGIEVGDWVLTATEGEIAQVMVVDEAPAQGRSLHSFGANGQPFVSEDHILISNSERLVSIDIDRALFFEPQFANQLTTLKKGVDLRVWKDGQFRSENVSHIVKQSIGDPDMILYNLILKTGHTYIANGYAVSDHFPDLGQFPKMFKLLHWVFRENVIQVEEFFGNQHKYEMKPLVQQITHIIRNFIKEQKHS